MEELYAVYIESLDQDLRVFDNQADAQAHFDLMQSEGKAVKMEKFTIYQVTGVEKANGAAAADPGFWEQLSYDNGNCTLVELYSWHQPPEKEGYYAEYSLEWK
jgi:hypothetical protein